MTVPQFFLVFAASSMHWSTTNHEQVGTKLYITVQHEKHVSAFTNKTVSSTINRQSLVHCPLIISLHGLHPCTPDPGFMDTHQPVKHVAWESFCLANLSLASLTHLPPLRVRRDLHYPRWPSSCPSVWVGHLHVTVTSGHRR